MSTLKVNSIEASSGSEIDINSTLGTVPSIVVSNLNVTGVVTATSFSGSGANLTGVAATSNISTNAIVNSGVTTVAAGSAAAPSITPTGDTNTGIFFPSADTIAFGEGGSEAARIDSSGRFGIGTASPGYKLDVYHASNGNGWAFNPGNLTTTNSLYSLKNSGSGLATARHEASDYHFIVGNNEAARLDTSGRLLVGTPTATANGGVLQVSNGITFPATQSACSDVNTLDDYEEGTFTPAITFGGGATSLTYTGRVGRYTKIGNVVYFVVYIELSNKGSSTGSAQITSLPFTSLSTFVRFRINIGYEFMTGTAPRDGYVSNSTTSIQLLTSSELNTLTNASFQNNTQLYLSGFYTVS